MGKERLPYFIFQQFVYEEGIGLRDDGNWVSDPGELQGMVIQFDKDLYSSLENERTMESGWCGWIESGIFSGAIGTFSFGSSLLS